MPIVPGACIENTGRRFGQGFPQSGLSHLGQDHLHIIPSPERHHLSEKPSGSLKRLLRWLPPDQSARDAEQFGTARQICRVRCNFGRGRHSMIIPLLKVADKRRVQITGFALRVIDQSGLDYGLRSRKKRAVVPRSLVSTRRSPTVVGPTVGADQEAPPPREPLVSKM